MLDALGSHFPSLKRPETESRFLYGCIAGGVVFSVISPAGSVALLVLKISAAVISALCLLTALCARLVRNQSSGSLLSEPGSSNQTSSPSTSVPDVVSSLPAPKPKREPVNPQGSGFTIVQTSQDLNGHGRIWGITFSDGSKVFIENPADQFKDFYDNGKYRHKVEIAGSEVFERDITESSWKVDDRIRSLLRSGTDSKTEILWSLCNGISRSPGPGPWISRVLLLFREHLSRRVLSDPLTLRLLTAWDGDSVQQVWDEAFPAAAVSNK